MAHQNQQISGKNEATQYGINCIIYASVYGWVLSILRKFAVFDARQCSI